MNQINSNMELTWKLGLHRCIDVVELRKYAGPSKGVELHQKENGNLHGHWETVCGLRLGREAKL